MPWGELFIAKKTPHTNVIEIQCSKGGGGPLGESRGAHSETCGRDRVEPSGMDNVDQTTNVGAIGVRRHSTEGILLTLAFVCL